ncbi:phage tail tape measure protein [Formosa haliotis]|uniref:phage tail tape measure protein n=1 Tax=Formosa haliotis TaxID=1555194 RepID=UPI00082594ED|nr:phage tail tape measure protein [Formosa haliotis]
MAVVSGDNSLFFTAEIDTTGLKSDSADVVNIVQSLSSTIAKINPFAALAVSAAAAFATISTDAYNLARDFENAMKEVETISEATQENFDGIAESVFALSKVSPDGPEKLAKAYYQIVSAGYDGAQGLQLLEVATKAAVAGVTDTITAADGITTVLNAFKLDAAEAENVADILFKTVQLGKTTFSELAASMSTVAPIAAASNIDFTEVSAAIATLTKQGVPTAQAMTQIRAAIVGVNKVLGDGWSETLTLQEAFSVLADEANGSQTELQEMVGTIEAVGAILGTTGRNASGAASDLEAMSNAANSSSDAFERMASSNVNQLEILRNRLRGTTEDIGKAVLSMSNRMAAALNDLFEENDKLSRKYDEQADAINELYIEYTSLETTQERQIQILKEIESINPSIVSGIDDQTNAYDKLGQAVRNYNAYVLNKKITDEKFGEDIKNIEIVIEESQKISKKISANLYEEYGDFLKNLPKLTQTYQNELNSILDGEGDRLEKIRKIRELLIDRNSNLPSNARITVPFSEISDYDDQVRQVNTFGELLDKTNKKAKDFLTTLSDNSNDAPFIVEEIKGITTLNELYAKYGDFRTKAVVEAVKAQETYLNNQAITAAEIEKINNVTREQYSQNKNILKSSLESENAEIAKAAEKEKHSLNIKYLLVVGPQLKQIYKRLQMI